MKQGGKKTRGELRLEAEKKLKIKSLKSVINLTETDKLKLIHELEVHQIELEMQNEELMRAHSMAKEAVDKYTELFDFAPFGYFILSRKGEIIDVNISGAKMLGKNREQLDNRRFSLFISQDSVPVFNLFLDKVFAANTQETCEVTLAAKQNVPLIVQLQSIVPENASYCRISMVDISEKKQLHNAVLNAILLAEENEKSIFSNELNENLGPLLSVINLYLSSIDTSNFNPKQQEQILKSKELLNDSITLVREISSKMSPHTLIKYGLASAIREYVRKLHEFSDLDIEFGSNLERRLQNEIEITLFRATIEFIKNSIKHAKAKNIQVTLYDSGDSINLSYQDDGIGFDLLESLSDKRGYGLINLENRIKAINGVFKMNSEPGVGVNYQVIIKV